jgi:exonuclease VII small subunit
LATDIVELSVDGAAEYPGNYELYLYQKQQENQNKQQPDGVQQKKPLNKSKQESVVAPKVEKLSTSEVKALERKIQKLEHDIQRTENSFASLKFGTASFADADKKLQALRKELQNTMTEWEASQH